MTNTRFKFRCIALVLACSLSSAARSNAQPKEEHKLVQFQMAILKKGPAWDSTNVEDRNSILQQHLKNVLAMLNSGKLVIAGPFDDSSDVAGLFIFRTSL